MVNKSHTGLVIMFGGANVLAIIHQIVKAENCYYEGLD
jgi:hypothetical protein